MIDEDKILEFKRKITSALRNEILFCSQDDYRLTGSSMPVCPRQVLLYKTKWMARTKSAKSDSALSNGTLNHSIVQSWLTKSGMLLGKYESNNKIYPSPQYVNDSKKNDVDSYDMNCICLDEKPQSSVFPTYKEIRVYDKSNGASGYLDGIIKLDKDDEYWHICDFKFVGDYTYTKLSLGLGENDSYRYQLNFYRYLLGKKLPIYKGKEIKLSKTMLLIVFDEGFVRNGGRINIIPVHYDKEMYLNQKHLLKQTLQNIEDKNKEYFLSDESKICKTQNDCHFCKARCLCFADNFKKMMNKEIESLWKKQS